MSALLEAAGLRFAYGRRPVLDEVSLALGPGELVGVIGPNGAGKTTLVRLLAGVLAPAGGSVRLADRPLSAYRRRELARRLAVVPQDAHLEFPFTALEVVLMGRAAHLPPLGFPRARDLAVARAAMQRLEVAHHLVAPHQRFAGECHAALVPVPAAACEHLHRHRVEHLVADHDAGKALGQLLHPGHLAREGRDPSRIHVVPAYRWTVSHTPVWRFRRGGDPGGSGCPLPS